MIKTPGAVPLCGIYAFVSSCWCQTRTCERLFRCDDLSRPGVSCHRRGITHGSTRVTMCLCFYPSSHSSPSGTPLFMGGSRPLFFCLNNWLEARPEEGGKEHLVGKKRRKVGDTLLSNLILPWWRWWLHIPFLASPLTHLLHRKVALFLPFPSFLLSHYPGPLLNLTKDFSLSPPGYFLMIDPSSNLCQAVKKSKKKKKVLNGRKTLNSGKEGTHTPAEPFHWIASHIWPPYKFPYKIKTTLIHPGAHHRWLCLSLKVCKYFLSLGFRSLINDLYELARVYVMFRWWKECLLFSSPPPSGVVYRGQDVQASRSIASNVLL